jgi:hypothetical protein
MSGHAIHITVDGRKHAATFTVDRKHLTVSTTYGKKTPKWIQRFSTRYSRIGSWSNSSRRRRPARARRLRGAGEFRRVSPTATRSAPSPL